MTRNSTDRRAAQYSRPVMHPRTLLVCVLSLVATAAFPAVGFAQAAGDTEYAGVAGVNVTAPPAVAPAAVAPEAGTAAETAEGSTPTPATATPATAQVAGASTNSTLPFTGRDVVFMLLVGLGLTGLGLVLRTAVGRATPAG